MTAFLIFLAGFLVGAVAGVLAVVVYALHRSGEMDRQFDEWRRQGGVE
jgi:hypothetical protein